MADIREIDSFDANFEDEDELDWDDGYFESDQLAASLAPWYIVSADDLKRAVWDVMSLFMILYQALLIPYRMCFDVQAEGPTEILEIIIDACFMLDVVLNFFTTYYDSGVQVFDHKKIALNYLQTWFLVDVIASFPYDWVLPESAAGEEQGGREGGNSDLGEGAQLFKIFKITKLLRVLRLLRVFKLKKLLVKFEEVLHSDMMSVSVQMFRLLVIVFFIAHWFGCLWYYIGDSQKGFYPATWLTSFPHALDGVELMKYEDEDLHTRYIVSLYWAFTTMTTVGYGDIYPVNQAEHVFGMLTMIVACGVFAFFVGAIGAVVRKLDASAAQFRAKKKAVSRYFRRRHLPRPLQIRIKRFLEFVWQFDKEVSTSEDEILRMLSPPLRTEVMVHLVGDIIKTAPFLSNIPRTLLQKICQIVTRVTHAPGDIIYEENEHAAAVFFIIKGRVKLSKRQGQTSITLGYKTEGSHFGETSLFMEKARTETVKCISFCETICLRKQSLVEILAMYPKYRVQYEDLKAEIEAGNMHKLGVPCMQCEELGHTTDKCPVLFTKTNVVTELVSRAFGKKEKEGNVWPFKALQKKLPGQAED